MHVRRQSAIDGDGLADSAESTRDGTTKITEP
jgi:hypothetical protein